MSGDHDNRLFEAQKEPGMRRFLVIALIFAVTLGLVACGGDEPEAEPTAAPAATEAPAATSEPAATQTPEQKDSSTPANIVFTIDPARSTAPLPHSRTARKSDLAQ